MFQNSDPLIKFVTSSKENDEQFKSNLKNFYLLYKTCLRYMAVLGELRNKSTGDYPQQLNYAAGRLVSVMVYYLRFKFESTG